MTIQTYQIEAQHSGFDLERRECALTFAKKSEQAIQSLLQRGPSDRGRTCGLMVPNHPRYQLRYTRI